MSRCRICLNCQFPRISILLYLQKTPNFKIHKVLLVASNLLDRVASKQDIVIVGILLIEYHESRRICLSKLRYMLFKCALPL